MFFLHHSFVLTFIQHWWMEMIPLQGGLHPTLDAQVSLVPPELTGVMKGGGGVFPRENTWVPWRFQMAWMKNTWIFQLIPAPKGECEVQHVLWRGRCMLCPVSSDPFWSMYRCFWIVWAEVPQNATKLTKLDNLEVIRIPANCCHKC